MNNIKNIVENIGLKKLIIIIAIVFTAIILIIVGVKHKKTEKYPIEIASSDIKTEEKNNNNEIIENTIQVEQTVEEEIVEVEGDTSWDEQNVEDTQVKEKEKEEKVKQNTAKYYIRINYTANVVTIYSKDNTGNYTVPVKAMVCSTGKATPTSGTYKMSSKYRWHLLNGGVYGQYCTRITGHILFHSVPYSKNSPDSLKYVAYDKLGTKASAGCIRLTVADAMWIYNNCASGTYVEFYGSSNPGPLGKPGSQKISSNVSCRNWDPTDPDPNNPWRGNNGFSNTQIKNEPQINNNTKNNTNNSSNNNSNNNNNNEQYNKDDKKDEEENKNEVQNTVNETNTNNTTTNTNTNTNTNTVKPSDNTNNKTNDTNTSSNTNSTTNTNSSKDNTSVNNTKKENTSSNITKETSI